MQQKGFTPPVMMQQSIPEISSSTKLQWRSKESSVDIGATNPENRKSDCPFLSRLTMMEVLLSSAAIPCPEAGKSTGVELFQFHFASGNHNFISIVDVGDRNFWISLNIKQCYPFMLWLYFGRILSTTKNTLQAMLIMKNLDNSREIINAWMLNLSMKLWGQKYPRRF